MKLSNYVKQYRTKNNLTQREFAKLCGFNQAYRISLIENNTVKISYKTIRALAKAMNLSETYVRKLYENRE